MLVDSNQSKLTAVMAAKVGNDSQPFVDISRKGRIPTMKVSARP
jgi:hypothetical protein